MERLKLLTNNAITMGGGDPWRYAGLSVYGKSNGEGVTSGRPCTTRGCGTVNEVVKWALAAEG
jgi:hypothetical protein